MPEPQSSQPTFTGGQCDGVGYLVFVAHEARSSSAGPWTTYYPGANVALFGPIGKAYGINGDNLYVFGRGYYADGEPGPYQAYGVYSSTSSQFRNVYVSEVYRYDGQPDNCGTLPTTEDPDRNPYNPKEDNNCCTLTAPF